jgi:hypothetical protein
MKGNNLKNNINILYIYAMGKIGEVIGENLGRIGGRYVGDKYFHNGDAGANIGATVGNFAGSYLPFKHGGIVKTKNGRKTKLIRAHAGELIVPKNMVKDVSKALKMKIKRNGGRNLKYV